MAEAAYGKFERVYADQSGFDTLRLRGSSFRMLIVLIHPTSDKLQVLTLRFILQAFDTSRLLSSHLYPSKLAGQLIHCTDLLVNHIPPLHDVAPAHAEAKSAVDPILCSLIPSGASLLIVFIEVEAAETALSKVYEISIWRCFSRIGLARESGVPASDLIEVP